MDGGEIIGLVAVLGIFVIPSLGLTARFALKPIVESVLRLRDALDRQRPTVADQRLELLEQRMTEMQHAVERLEETVEFHAQLGRGSPGVVHLPASGSAGSPTHR